MATLHQTRTHPTYVDGCSGCKFATLLISPAVISAVREDGTYRTQRRHGTLDADMAAYRRLRMDGLQPPHISGSAALEQHADHPYEVAVGKLYPGQRGKQLKDAIGFVTDGGMDPLKPHTTPRPVED